MEESGYPKESLPMSSIARGEDRNSDRGTQEIESCTPVGNKTCLVERLQNLVRSFFKRYKKSIRKIVIHVLIFGYSLFFVAAMATDVEKASSLAVMTSLVTTYGLYRKISNCYEGSSLEEVITKQFKGCCTRIRSRRRIIQKLLMMTVGLSLLAGITYVVVEDGLSLQQLSSVAGLVLIPLFLALTTKYPAHMTFRPFLVGFALQISFALLILRTEWGLWAFTRLGDKVQLFLSYADYGSKFVFGETYAHHFFAFKVLPVIVFFSSCISVFYHLGIMKFVISKIAWVMKATMGTSATESLIAAANIFVGQTEAPVLVRPFLESMTNSEIHAMLCAGYATIAGGVLAAYILFGVPGQHLICASVMNAPIALGISKLSYPERSRERSTAATTTNILTQKKEHNVFGAAASGAADSIVFVANIAANLIAFQAILAVTNDIVSWLGSLVNHPEFDFSMLCSYLFMPMSLIIGVRWADCGEVGRLMGIKTFLNEFVAYEELAEMMKNREVCTGKYISPRSEVIATYALCGFANLTSIGLQLGGIGAMVPSRRNDISKLTLRALVCGTLATFLTASIAGLITKEIPSNCESGFDITTNSTYDWQNSTTFTESNWNFTTTASVTT